jgi:hypothetical protein
MAAGAYTWRFAATAGGQTCTSTGTVTVQAPSQAYRYMVPFVAHWPGASNTAWRSDVTAVNRSSTSTTVTLSYRSVTDSMTATYGTTLAAGGPVWRESSSMSSASPDRDHHNAHVSADVPSWWRRGPTTRSRPTYGQFVPALGHRHAHPGDGLCHSSRRQVTHEHRHR